MPKKDSSLIVECPHCQTYVLIDSINCGIFRHGQYKDIKDYKDGKDNFRFVDPHLSESDCNKLLESGLVYGCMKPFRIIKKNKHEFEVEICGYI